MTAADLKAGDRINLRHRFGYVTRADVCEHGLMHLAWRWDTGETQERAAFAFEEITSGLEVLGPHKIEGANNG